MGAKEKRHAETVLQLARNRSYFTSVDIQKLKVPRVIVTRLVRSGQIERICRGLYRHPNAPSVKISSLVPIAHATKTGVFCLITALAFHEVIPKEDIEIWIAVSKKIRSSCITKSDVHLIKFSASTICEGVESYEYSGITIHVFSLARTIADCFKFKNFVSHSVTIQGLRTAWVKGLVTIEELERYAELCNVQREIRPYLDSLIWLKRS